MVSISFIKWVIPLLIVSLDRNLKALYSLSGLAQGNKHINMGDRQQQQSVQPSAEDMIASVNALDAALLPCLHEIEPRPDTVLDLQAPLTTAFEELPATEHGTPDEYPPPSDHQSL